MTEPNETPSSSDPSPQTPSPEPSSASATEQPGTDTPKKKIPFRQIAIGSGIALVVILIFQNTALAQIDVLFWTTDIPLWILLVLTFIVGGISGIVLDRRRRKKKTRGALRKAVGSDL